MRLRNIITCALAATVAMSAAAERLVILHTNDTHSNIESDRNGVGGILPRKAIIDSVRKAEKNGILLAATWCRERSISNISVATWSIPCST